MSKKVSAVKKAQPKKVARRYSEMTESELKKVFDKLGFVFLSKKEEENRFVYYFKCTCKKLRQTSSPKNIEECDTCNKQIKCGDLEGWMEKHDCNFISVFQDGEEYDPDIVVNYSSNVKFECFCGVEHITTWYSFNEGERCINCSILFLIDMFDEIRKDKKLHKGNLCDLVKKDLKTIFGLEYDFPILEKPIPVNKATINFTSDVIEAVATYLFGENYRRLMYDQKEERNNRL